MLPCLASRFAHWRNHLPFTANETPEIQVERTFQDCEFDFIPRKYHRQIDTQLERGTNHTK